MAATLRNPGDSRRARAFALELAVVSTVYLLYRSGRMFTRDASSQAMRNAGLVIDVERSLGIFSEKALQGWALGSDSVIDVMNRYYVGVHFPVTIAFLAWAYLRHPGAYRIIRTWFVIVTMAALAIHVGFPLAPPRMMPGFVDTLHEFGPRIYSTDPRRSVANQFAAMPSLHFGWSLMLAVGFVAIKRSRRSAIAFVHPAITLFAIVATGNHYWMDAIVAGLLVALVGAAIAVWLLFRTPGMQVVTRRAVSQAPDGAEPLDDDIDQLTYPDRGCPVASGSRERCRQRLPGPHEQLTAEPACTNTA
jgi:hypothetical protein